ncbi:MAG: hypothetical protein Q7O66_16190, partial [Dehalococcoidia bacterium]|nr:hypothetical protein [Dehalococcoidia bacterium]
SQDAANRDKLAPGEYYLDLAAANHKAMKESGLYDKYNKLSLCAMDCITHVYAGDLGILELSGNVGNWLSDVIPEKANWLARFNSSVTTR